MGKNRNNFYGNRGSANEPDKQEEAQDKDIQDIEIGEVTPDESPEEAEAAETGENELEKKISSLEADLAKEKKEYLFLMAEFDNFRKRTVKEKSDIIKNAAESVLKGLLPIVDDFERGLEASAKSDDPASVRQGMELIYQKLVKFLASNGVKPIESTGKPFDAELHEAIAMVPAADESQKGIVIDTPTKGYTINDKVLRHAKVAVGQ